MAFSALGALLRRHAMHLSPAHQACLAITPCGLAGLKLQFVQGMSWSCSFSQLQQAWRAPLLASGPHGSFTIAASLGMHDSCRQMPQIPVRRAYACCALSRSGLAAAPG